MIIIICNYHYILILLHFSVTTHYVLVMDIGSTDSPVNIVPHIQTCGNFHSIHPSPVDGRNIDIGLLQRTSCTTFNTLPLESHIIEVSLLSHLSTSNRKIGSVQLYKQLIKLIAIKKSVSHWQLYKGARNLRNNLPADSAIKNAIKLH